MEKQTLQNCNLLPHSCSLGITAPKSIDPPGMNLPDLTARITNKPSKKLWSVYEGVYWI